MTAVPEPILPTNNLNSSATSTKSNVADPNHHPSKPQSPALKRFRANINKTYADIPICLCSMVSGLCDSVAFNASQVFVSMQTGNTVFLALGASHLPSTAPYLWLRALVSIVAFWMGVFFFSKSRHVRPVAKGTLAASFLLQALFILVAAALAQGGVVATFARLHVAEELQRDEVLDPRVLGPIALLAFQFGGQIVSSRFLGFNEVPTNVLTSVYCDLFSDPALLAPWGENPKRNRRAATVILTTVGAVAGGWLSRSGAGMSAALWIGGFLKFGIAVAWMFWHVKEEDE